MVTERRVVYLLGLVSPAEGDAAAEIAATTSDVVRVVKLFEYRDLSGNDGGVHATRAALSREDRDAGRCARAHRRACRDRWCSRTASSTSCIAATSPTSSRRARWARRSSSPSTRDASVRRLGKGADRPLNPLADRMAVLAALAAVDLVVPFDDDTPRDLIAACLPDVLVKGGDYTAETTAGASEVIAAGGRFVAIPFATAHSTSALIARIRA